MKKIVIVHQSSELYGSDKTLLLFLKYLDRDAFFPVVVLPDEGPLLFEIQKLDIDVYITPVIKLHRKMFTLGNLFSTITQALRSIKFLRNLDKQYGFDLVYSNTLAVLLGYIYAGVYKVKHLWHVHEIIQSPKIVVKVFSFLLKSKTNRYIIYNSFSTANYWEGLFQLPERKNYSVVHNGIEPFALNDTTEGQAIRKEFFKADDPIIIGLVGRINKWKGQDLLLSAFTSLSKQYQNIRLVFVGSAPPNQEFYSEELKKKISILKNEEIVRLIPFQENVAGIWKALDIAVVPSTEPEPFGLVAVEAMFAEKPVVASNHGGLTEIVKNNETGFLFAPGDVNELQNALSVLIENKTLRLEMGKKGLDRAHKMFSVTSYVHSIEEVLSHKI